MNAVVDPSYRPLGLETDVSNRNFAGAARTPMTSLWVQFTTEGVAEQLRDPSPRSADLPGMRRG